MLSRRPQTGASGTPIVQFILMLAGMGLGLELDGSNEAIIAGGLFGLIIGQALALRQLKAQLARQDIAQKQTLAAMEAFQQRLAQLDDRSVVPVSDLESAPVAAPEPRTAPRDEHTSHRFTAPPADVQSAPAEPLTAAPLTQAPPALPLEPIPARPPVNEPRRPSLAEKAYAHARDWLLGGNSVLRVGAVLLFFGLAFLLRYATEGMVVPIELRYAGVAAAALVLLGLGGWLRPRNRQYALMLQGTGIAVLYLTVFAAMRLHPLLGPATAFALLVAVTVFSALLAVRQDSLPLACAAALGGFAAPILTSSGDGSHIALFSYFAILNAGILAIAWFKAWRTLNVIGFAGTFSIGLTWGLRSYTPALLWSTEPFLVLFFVMYLAIGLLFARRKLRDLPAAPADGSQQARTHWAAHKNDYVDGTLLFGPPLVGFGLQVALVQHLEYATAFSALVLGILYMSLARFLRGGRGALLGEACLVLGLIFASLAIPLALDANWTAAAWAVEGAGVYWLGLRQLRPIARAFALLLQLGSALAFISELDAGGASLIHGSWLGALMLGAALLCSFNLLRTTPPTQTHAWEKPILPLLACAGLVFLYLLAPLFFSYQGTTISWALAGLATLLIGLRLPSRTFVFTALAVQGLGGLLFLLQWLGIVGGASAAAMASSPYLPGRPGNPALQPFINGLFWMPMTLALAAMIGAWRLHAAHRARSLALPDLPRLSVSLLAWGAAWWTLALTTEVLRFAPTELIATLWLGAAALSVALWTGLARRLDWPALGALCCALMPAAALVLLLTWQPHGHPAANLGWLAWAAVFSVHFLSQRLLAARMPTWAASAAHVLGCWLLIGVLTLELRYGLVLASPPGSAWRWLGWAILPSLYLVLMASPRAWPWPVSTHAREYRRLAPLPLAALTLGWFWLANIASAGDAAPLPYVPLLNPLDIGLLFALFGVARWSRSAQGQAALSLNPKGIKGSFVYPAINLDAIAGVSLFAFLTAVVMRTAHHWAGVPYELSALLESMLVQASLSLVWTLIALGLMIGGHLRHRRTVWLAGAALIAVVVAKLVFVELSNSGGLARIVSFIGVGALLLVVGYFAPLPPKRADTAGGVEAGGSP